MSAATSLQVEDAFSLGPLESVLPTPLGTQIQVAVSHGEEEQVSLEC